MNMKNFKKNFFQKQYRSVEDINGNFQGFVSFGCKNKGGFLGERGF